MPRLLRSLLLTLAAGLGAAGLASAQETVVPYADSLRAEWAVESTRAGRARVVGYLHNRNTKEAADVWLRVDQLAADGTVLGTYRQPMVGDVPAGGRSLFDVPVGEAGARYRLTVEAVSWTDKQCR